MPGRHSVPIEVRRQHRQPRVFKWAALAVVAIVLIGLGIFAFTKFGGGSGCDSVDEFSVAADATIAPVITKIADDTSAEDLGCAKLTVEAKPSAEVAATLTRPEGAPALWIPDSSLWTVRAAKLTGTLLDVASQSVATTPDVIATRKDDAPLFNNWLEVLNSPGGIRIGDPLTDTVADAPIVAALAEAEQGKVDRNAVTAAVVPIAQAQQANPQRKSADERLGEVVRDGGLAISTEQQLVEYNAQNASANLQASVPLTGTFVLNYPIAVTEPSGGNHSDAKDAGIKLAEALEGDAGRRALSEAGFRLPNMSPLSGDRGLGDEQVVPLNLTDTEAIANLLRQYAVLALPSKFLAVLDVSGSMNIAAGTGTRMSLMIQAMEAGLMRFPDNAQIGLWAFSIDKGGPGQDWRAIVPTRQLGENVDGKLQKQVLLEEARGLTAIVGGGTGLYDTTLAAFREAQKNYDPKYVNSVVLATDGANEDSNSISLQTLLDTLKNEQDPARPVIIVTIGITQDADARVLEQISAATGGKSYTTTNVADIPNVIVDVLQARTTGR